MHKSNINKVKKLISRGLFYSIKIQLFKILLNKKSAGKVFRKLTILILYNVTKYMKYKYFWDISSEEWEHLSEKIFKYIENKHLDYITEYYNKKCKK